MPDRPRSAIDATLDFVLACIEGDRFKDSLGQTAENYVRYSLNQSAHAYHVQGFLDVEREVARYRRTLEAIANHPSGTSRAGEAMRRYARETLDGGDPHGDRDE